MPKNVLITGASGLIGSRLTDLLLARGYQVSHLGRSRTSKNQVKSYIWNIQDGFIEDGAIEKSNIVVHLAGAAVVDKRWTSSRKQKILQSRVQTTSLLFEKLSNVDHVCETVISASAIGYYGTDTGDIWLDEESPTGSGFLAEVTRQWELQSARLKKLKLRVVMLRTGIVLSDKGGALPRIAQTVKLNLGAAFGTGDQYMSWIHIDDHCGIIIKSIEDSRIQGAYNSVAPNPVTNNDFIQTLAKVFSKRIWLPAVPGFLLRIALGEMAGVVLGGNRVSSNKIQSTGYEFGYSHLITAFSAIFRKDTKGDNS
jgi:uncharacterized protein (TIGR01777 family)